MISEDDHVWSDNNFILEESVLEALYLQISTTSQLPSFAHLSHLNDLLIAQHEQLHANSISLSPGLKSQVDKLLQLLKTFDEGSMQQLDSSASTENRKRKADTQLTNEVSRPPCNLPIESDVQSPESLNDLLTDQPDSKIFTEEAVLRLLEHYNTLCEALPQISSAQSSNSETSSSSPSPSLSSSSSSASSRLKQFQSNSSSNSNPSEQQQTIVFLGTFDVHGNILSFTKTNPNQPDQNTYDQFSQKFTAHPTVFELVNESSLPELLGLMADLTSKAAFSQPMDYLSVELNVNACFWPHEEAQAIQVPSGQILKKRFQLDLHASCVSTWTCDLSVVEPPAQPAQAEHHNLALLGLSLPGAATTEADSLFHASDNLSCGPEQQRIQQASALEAALQIQSNYNNLWYGADDDSAGSFDTLELDMEEEGLSDAGIGRLFVPAHIQGFPEHDLDSEADFLVLAPPHSSPLTLDEQAEPDDQPMELVLDVPVDCSYSIPSPWQSVMRTYNETKRLKKVFELDAMRPDKSPNPLEYAIPCFQDVAVDAASIFDVPISLVSILYEDKQIFRGNVGMSDGSSSRQVSFCTFTISHSEDIFMVKDARLDKRFDHNPLVLQDPSIVSYMGVKLETKDGYSLGTLCVIDTHPRTYSQYQCEQLKAMAKLTTSMFEEGLQTYVKPAPELPFANDHHNHMAIASF